LPLRDDPEHAVLKAELALHLPNTNAPWHANSFLSINPYFDDDIKRRLKSD